MTATLNFDKYTLFKGSTMAAIENKINDFLATKKPFKDAPLILAANNRSKRHNYRGITIRQWWYLGGIRYDAAVELENRK